MTGPGFRCSDDARARADPTIGSAPLTTAYLLIEHPGPWRFAAAAGAGWSVEVTDALARAVRHTRGRVLLIRRPGRQQARTRRAWAVVLPGVGSHWGTWADERDLLAAADIFRTLSTELRPRPPSDTGLSADPLLLVCTHGVHDACCALRGRPVAAALSREWPDATWECSHVGGDRFAANLVVLPDGTYYGGLDAEDAPRIVAEHLSGRIDLSHLRGSVRWSPPAQAAVAEVHRRLGPFGAGEVRAGQTASAGTESGGTASWRVEVSTADHRRFAVEVIGEQRAPAMLTCAAGRPSTSLTYAIRTVTDLSSPPDVTIP